MAKGKTCLRCRKWRILSRFSPMAAGRHGRHSYCKPCRSEVNGPKFALWRKKNVVKHRKYMREYMRERRGST